MDALSKKYHHIHSDITSELNVVQEAGWFYFYVRILSIVIIPNVGVTPIRGIAKAKLVNVSILYPYQFLNLNSKIRYFIQPCFQQLLSVA